MPVSLWVAGSLFFSFRRRLDRAEFHNHNRNRTRMTQSFINSACCNNLVYVQTEFPNQTQQTKESALVAAVYYSCDDVIRFLLKNGVTPNAQNENGLYALFTSFRWQPGSSKLLLENGADPNTLFIDTERFPNHLKETWFKLRHPDCFYLAKYGLDLDKALAASMKFKHREPFRHVFTVRRDIGALKKLLFSGGGGDQSNKRCLIAKLVLWTMASNWFPPQTIQKQFNLQ